MGGGIAGRIRAVEVTDHSSGAAFAGVTDTIDPLNHGEFATGRRRPGKSLRGAPGADRLFRPRHPRVRSQALRSLVASTPHSGRRVRAPADRPSDDPPLRAAREGRTHPESAREHCPMPKARTPCPRRRSARCAMTAPGRPCLGARLRRRRPAAGAGGGDPERGAGNRPSAGRCGEGMGAGARPPALARQGGGLGRSRGEEGPRDRGDGRGPGPAPSAAAP